MPYQDMFCNVLMCGHYVHLLQAPSIKGISSMMWGDAFYVFIDCKHKYETEAEYDFEL
jgi:hypothetical protein